MVRFAQHAASRRNCQGISLVEVLISVTLLTMIVLASYSLVTKANLTGTSFSGRNRALIELESLFQTMRQNIAESTQIDPKSFNRKIILTHLDSNNQPKTLIYQIVNVGGKDILQISNDGGTTWESPYNIAADTTYAVTGKFIYCGVQNGVFWSTQYNCTQFTDTNGNGQFDAGIDTAALAPGFSGTALTRPEQATKVLLSGFSFDRQTGNPPIKRSFPEIFVKLKPISIWSTVTKVNKFATNSGSFNAAFQPYSILWDTRGRQLMLAGHGQNALYGATREGAAVSFYDKNTSTLSTPLDLSGTYAGAVYDGMALETYDGQNILYLLDNTASKVYRYDLLNYTPVASLDFTAGGAINTGNAPAISPLKAVAYDLNTPTDFYLLGTISGVLKIDERNKTTGARVVANGGPWALPAGLTSPSGMTVDPLTGDFYVADKDPTCGGAPSTCTLKIWHITRSSPTTTDTFNITLNVGGAGTGGIGSVATNLTTNWFNLSIEPDSNRLFLSSLADNAVFEIAPDRLLIPKL